MQGELIKPGDIYEDGQFHPVLCFTVEDGIAMGISLIDGSYGHSGDVFVGGLRKLTLEEAWECRTAGPEEMQRRWEANHFQ